MGHQSVCDGETAISTLMDFQGPFSDIPLFEDYLRITNRSEQPSTAQAFLVVPAEWDRLG